MFPKSGALVLVIALVVAFVLVPNGSFHTWRVVGFIVIPILVLLRALIRGRVD